jgi:hypothetical protein
VDGAATLGEVGMREFGILGSRTWICCGSERGCNPVRGPSGLAPESCTSCRLRFALKCGSLRQPGHPSGCP